MSRAFVGEHGSGPVASKSAPPTPPRRTEQGERRPLEVRALHKRYGAVAALDGVSLTVRPGEICGFVGANGAGKTTTMRIVMGVVPADSGEVHWDGRPVTATARQRFGYMPEERGLYPRMRVYEQLAYFGRLHGMTRPEAQQAARRWIERLGIADRAGDRLEKLSLGNQQRVQLAAALVHDPELLVLDEPFSGLDPVGVDALSEVLRERAAEGAAVLFSSHQLELVERLCDAVAIISEARMVAAGSVDRMRAGERRLLRVHVTARPASPDIGAGWAEGIDSVEVVRSDEHGTLLALGDHVDTQTVLDAARATGAVEHFGLERRSLAEIYREAVES